MLSLLRLLIVPHKKLFVVILALLIWMTAWFTFLSQALDSITSYLDKQTVESLGGDVVIEGAKPLSLENKNEVEQLFGSPFKQSATIRFLNSLTIGTGQPLLTTILGYDENYPLYGTLQTSTSNKNGVYISDSLASLTTEKTIAVGEATFPIDGTIVQMPTAGIQIFDGGRFVLLPISLLERTGLVQTGSRVSYRYAYTFDNPPSELLVDKIQEVVPEQEVTSLTSARSQREEFFTQLKSVIILALCSLIILTYSGLRIVNDMLIRRLLETMRLIRILGTTKRRLITSTGMLLMIIFVAGCILGGALGYQAWTLLPRSDFSFTPKWNRLPYREACLVTFGIMGALAFSRQELFQKDNLLSTSVYNNGSSVKQQVLSRSVIGVIMLLALLLELGWNRSSFVLGGALVGTMIILYLSVNQFLKLIASWTVTWKNTNRTRWRVIRRSSQPGSPMPLMLTLITSILTIAGSCFLFWQSITSYISDFNQTQQANTFILNLREQDKPQLEQVLPGSSLYDVILGRIVMINNLGLGDIIAKKQLRAGSYTREFNMTTVVQDDEVVAGYPTGTKLKEGEISVDSRVAESLGIQIGDQLVMSIVGREFTFTIVQLRRTTRNAIKPFFFFLLPVEQFADAPRSYFSLQSLNPSERPAILRNLSTTLGSHLSYIEVDDIIAQVQELLQAIAWAIVLVLSSVVICGGVLLLLSFHNLRKDHQRDMEILSVLGVEHSFVHGSGRNALLYPLLAATGISTFLLICIFVALRIFQDALPFSLGTGAKTLLLLCFLSCIMFVVILLLFRNKKKEEEITL